MTPLPLVTRAIALRKQTAHSFHPGIGYLAHSGPPDLPTAARGTANCDPPEGTPDGSVHLMRPPGAHDVMQMRWVAGERAWASLHPGRGNRLAWPTGHLSKAGWEYVGPVETEARTAAKRRK